MTVHHVFIAAPLKFLAVPARNSDTHGIPNLGNESIGIPCVYLFVLTEGDPI